MKSLLNFTYFLGFILFFSNIIFAKKDKSLLKKNKSKNSKENYYLIYVNNTHGEYQIFNTNKKQKRTESQIFVESLLEEINDLIIDNKDSYENPEELNEIEQASKLRKRSDSDESNFAYPVSSVDNSLVIRAYLSEALLEAVKSMPDVISCEPRRASFTLNHRHYNEKDILAETGWKNLAVRENADFHLSLLSQGIHDPSIVSVYDNNYYYPASAGKDVDIIVIDDSFDFNYHEFSNTEDRVLKCAANVNFGIASTDLIDLYCGNASDKHGEYVSDTAAGLIHGAASRANVYGISVPVDEVTGGIYDDDILAAFQFAYENLIRPHKTVINLSISGDHEIKDQYHKHSKLLFNNINKKGGIIVTSAGNDGKNLSKNAEKLRLPCQLDSVICVGGIGNDFSDISNSYLIDPDSTFGNGVDIYAPFHVVTEISSIDYPVSIDGTSFSSPLVAGVIATILSENPTINYTKKSMLKTLKKNGKSEVITYYNGSSMIVNNGKHIVYSEDNKYNGCGINAGNLPCSKKSKKVTTKQTKTIPTITTTTTTISRTKTIPVRPTKSIPVTRTTTTTTTTTTIPTTATKKIPVRPTKSIPITRTVTASSNETNAIEKTATTTTIITKTSKTTKTKIAKTKITKTKTTKTKTIKTKTTKTKTPKLKKTIIATSTETN